MPLIDERKREKRNIKRESVTGGGGGGHDYLRRGSNPSGYTDLSVFDDGKHTTRRKYLKWGVSYSKTGKRLKQTKWKPIQKLTTGHIEAILKLKNVDPFYRKVFLAELNYRKKITSTPVTSNNVVLTKRQLRQLIREIFTGANKMCFAVVQGKQFIQFDALEYIMLIHTDWKFGKKPTTNKKYYAQYLKKQVQQDDQTTENNT